MCIFDKKTIDKICMILYIDGKLGLTILRGVESY